MSRDQRPKQQVDHCALYTQNDLTHSFIIIYITFPPLHPQHAVETIWLAVRDLLEPSQPVEVRHTCLSFLKALIYGQVPHPSIAS